MIFFFLKEIYYQPVIITQNETDSTLFFARIPNKPPIFVTNKIEKLKKKKYEKIICVCMCDDVSATSCICR